MKKKIFVVEDDPLIALHISQALGSFGYEIVGSVRSGEEALKMIPEANPDLILMDITLLGKLDGIDTVSQLTVAKPVVFLTALSDEKTLQRAKLTKPYGYLIKPFDPHELRSTIELALLNYDEDSVNRRIRADEAILKDQDDLEFISEDQNGKLAILFQCETLKSLPQKNLVHLIEHSEIKQISAGEQITLEGNETAGGFITISGRVSITKNNSEGKELILNLLPPGDIFGLCFLLPSIATGISARCQIDSKILWISPKSYSAFINLEPEFIKVINNELAKRLVDSYNLAMSLAHTKVELRIVRTLIALLPNFGKNFSKDSNEGRIFITRKELSELTGTTPETAFRVTKNLEREGVLDLTKPGIIKITNISSLAEFDPETT